jgi:hypothetical protein
MATYKQIQEYIKAKYGFQPKTCWIADVKEQEGLYVKHAWNRTRNERQVPCPPEKIEYIRAALRHFRMIK